MALADSVIGELHLLEQMSSDEHLGSLAEAVLEAVKGHPEAARRVDQVRHRGLGMFIPNPDFYPSRTPDSSTAPEEEGRK